MCEGCCTLKRCRFGRWLPPPASAEKSCSTSASVFVPTTYLVPFLFKQEKSLLAFALRNIDALTDKWTTGTSRGRRNKSESQIFVFVFIRFAEINLFSKQSFLFFSCFACASVRPFVPIALILRTHWSQRPEPLFSENLFFQRALVRPSFRPSRTSYPSIPPSERDVGKGRSPLFFRELPRAPAALADP